MIIYPAIDIRGGKCVRLLKGEFSQQTVYGDDPSEMAAKWEAAGAKYLHLVDLDGALKGRSVNTEAIKKIARTVNIPIQLGGGIRNEEAIAEKFDAGVQRVILGTAAVNDPEFVKRVAQKYNERIVVGIDAKDGYAAVEGWSSVSDLRAVDFAKMMADIGISTVIYTDIATDGTLGGPNLSAMEEMVNAVPEIDVIASGGIATIDDIAALKTTGVAGAITGRALYANTLDLAEAIALAEE